jgi:hypothetical protein
MRVTVHRLLHKLEPNWVQARVLGTITGVGSV